MVHQAQVVLLATLDLREQTEDLGQEVRMESLVQPAREVELVPLGRQEPKVKLDLLEGQVLQTSELAMMTSQPLTGDAGPGGATGQRGLTGSTGINGQTGSTGQAGPQGLRGAVGATGVTGPQGATGKQGPQGIPGPRGATGADGLRGATGFTGTSGPVGATGGYNILHTSLTFRSIFVHTYCKHFCN